MDVSNTALLHEIPKNVIFWALEKTRNRSSRGRTRRIRTTLRRLFGERKRKSEHNTNMRQKPENKKQNNKSRKSNQKLKKKNANNHTPLVVSGTNKQNGQRKKYAPGRESNPGCPGQHRKS